MKNSKLDGDHRPMVSADALRASRMAQEQAKKDAGIWGDLSVGIIEHRQSAFIYVFKGLAAATMHQLAAKRPKEITKVEHDALCIWLKAGGFDGFKQRTSAWNINAEEALRMKQVIATELVAAGIRVVNPA